MIDNYDSFTYNLVQFLGRLGADLVVYRNDHTDLEEVKNMDPAGIVVSPGPRPVRCRVVQEDNTQLWSSVPVLGCAWGINVSAKCTEYGRSRPLRHARQDLADKPRRAAACSRACPAPWRRHATHSLAILEEGFPSCLEVSCPHRGRVDHGVRHREYPVEGIQFHPRVLYDP